jgi:hypothetical protein
VILSSKKVVKSLDFAEQCQPPKSGNSKFLEIYVDGTLNLCPDTPGTIQKESDQSDNPVLRKRSKHAEVLKYFDFSLKQQIGPHSGRFLWAG